MKPLIARISAVASGFLRWWILELAAALQDFIGWAWPDLRRKWVAYVSRSRLEVVEINKGRLKSIVEVVRDTTTVEITHDLSPAERSLLPRARNVRMIFDPEYAFIRRLRMPIAAMPHLNSAIDLQMGRLLPLNLAMVRTDFSVVGIDPQMGEATIELAALKRSDIEPIENVLRRWEMLPSVLQIGQPTQEHAQFTFGDLGSANHWRSMSRTDFALSVTAAVLTMAAIIVFAIQSYRAQVALSTTLATASSNGMAVLQQRQQLIDKLKILSLLTAAERDPSAASILSDVTARIGHDSWLTTFDLKGRELRLAGLSPDPASVVAGLTASALLNGIQLRSSTSGGTKERFEITARVKAGP